MHSSVKVIRHIVLFFLCRLDIYGSAGFYGISTIAGYRMPNPLFTYIVNIYDM